MNPTDRSSGTGTADPAVRQMLDQALAGLSDGVRQELSEAAEVVVLSAGATVMVEGDPADAMHLVTAGTVRLSIHQRQQDLAVATVGPGELLGWSWLVPPHRWDFDGATLGGATLVRIPATAIASAVQHRPEDAAELARTMVSVVSRRLRDTRVQLLDLYSRAGPPEAP